MIALVTTGRSKEKEYGSHRSADGSSLRSDGSSSRSKGKVKFQNAVKKVVHEKKKVEGKNNTISIILIILILNLTYYRCKSQRTQEKISKI